ncbi:hypothetical protein SLEP1_g6235 [Rubroshorea leprosula]|uniref:Uncharacterized protein n=2 Tax=Rubroshorea leprosula TaxID=152421 RepID=A0AAV5I2P8_9ROSI|nr:hypothetical protein SLEP1_g6235 [Rubroshorea leprosula]
MAVHRPKACSKETEGEEASLAMKAKQMIKMESIFSKYAETVKEQPCRMLTDIGKLAFGGHSNRCTT